MKKEFREKRPSKFKEFFKKIFYNLDLIVMSVVLAILLIITKI